MTPKDKAKELFDKYCHAIRTEECDDGYFTNVVHAKRCALIAVDEILEELFEVLMVTAISYINKHIDYWQEVKKEIEKL